MGAKQKGTSAERELVHLFWQNKWAASRVAGSGSMKYPSPDILASKNKRTIAIECKTTKDDNQYLTKEEVDALKEYAKITGAEAYIAVRFARQEWLFLKPEELDVTVSQYVVNKEAALSYGKKLSEILSPKGI